MAAALVAMPLAVVAALTLPPATPAQADPLPASPDAVASAQARATGQQVPVAADTTAYTDTVANPDGSFTTTFNERPQHARKGDTWVTPDAALQANGDGSVSPTASVSGLTLSGGGTGPFAVLDDHAGHTMTLRLPFTLPRPDISGATATYRAVLPGVDLVATATGEGGVSEVLVIRDAAAATNPALAELTLSASVTGLDLRVDPATGATSAINPDTGYPVFGSPPPQMWDSAAASPAQAQSLAQQQKTDPFDAVPATSSPARPGAAAHVTTIPVTAKPVAGGQAQITMAPPASALTGKDVTLPVYVDPPFSVATNPENYVESYHPTTVTHNPSDNLRTGLDDWPGSDGWQNGVTRTYLWYDINGILSKYVEEAHLQLNELDVSCSGTFTLNVGITNAWVSSPGATALDWNNQAGPTSSDPTLNSSRSVTGTLGGYQVPLTALVRHAQNSGWGSIGLVMYMDNESNDCGYRHWALNPQIAATYWSTPNAPAGLKQVNGNATTTCNTTSPGTWIGAATNDTITLTDTVSTPDVGYTLTSHMFVAADGGAYQDHPATITPVSGNNPITTQLAVQDGVSYTWYATASNQAGDNHVTSSAATPAGAPGSASCHFRYDATPPAAPVVSSTAYPPSGPTTVGPNGSGTISFTAVERFPTFCTVGPPPVCGPRSSGASGIASYTYSLNSAPPVTTTATNLQVGLSTLHWGTNVLSVRSTDVAGNVSQPTNYSFYVQQSAFGPYTPGTAGDVTGDNNPDLVTIDSAGNVRLFEHPDTVGVNPTGDTTADPLQYGGRILKPANEDSLWPGASFAGALVAHAGSFSGHNTDDLIIEQYGSLGVARNVNGNGTAWPMETGIPKPACDTCADYNGSDWSSVTQLVAVPTAAGGRPNLLTAEQVNGTASLWLYPAASTGIGFNAPTRIATYSGSLIGAFDNWQIVGAGPLPGSAGTTIWVRDPFFGAIRVIHNIEAGIPIPQSAGTTLAAAGYDRASYPLLASVGRADANGNLPLWAVGNTGQLTVIPTTTSTTGTTTLAATATASLSSTTWGGHEQALQSSYQPYNNMGIANDGNVEEGSFDQGTVTHSYSVSALANATLPAGITTSCPLARTLPCPAGISPGATVTVPQASGSYAYTMPYPWGHRLDNYQAAGQTIPAPLNPNFAPAQHISFLGAASINNSAGATGTATITYTDGHTQQVGITFTDWTRGAGAFPVAGGNITVATCAYRDTVANGTQDIVSTYLYATAEVALLDNGQPVPDGVQIASITLPVNSAIHIFGVAVN